MLIKSSEMLDEKHCSSAKCYWLFKPLIAVKASLFVLAFPITRGADREDVGTHCPKV